MALVVSSHSKMNLNEIVYGTERRPRTAKQWEDAAKENTHKIRREGSASPLVWVFVKGKDIPPNAIIAGEDRRRPLYIARTFFEGVTCIGRAGHHLERGAAFAFNGREFQSDAYEVLVPALEPLRYAISDTVQMPTIPRIVRNSVQTKEGLSSLKIVVVIDDSSSMSGRLWADARDVLASVVDLNARDPAADGIDLYFLNNTRSGTDLKDGNAVRKLFDLVTPEGGTPTGKKLQELFDRYIPLVENKIYHHPITIIVVTDGVPTDEPTEVIVSAARRLDLNGVPRDGRPFGIEFVQIGDDEEAADALRELDDDLAAMHGIRDMVDTTPYSSENTNFTMEMMLKILLGGVDKQFDAIANSLFSGSMCTDD